MSLGDIRRGLNRAIGGLNDIEADLEALEEAAGNAPRAPAWISVKDRLPNRTAENVLVSMLGFAGHIAIMQSRAVHDLKEITHWMPLPEPPKEGK